MNSPYYMIERPGDTMNVATFDSEMLQKLFYFSLRKTGSRHEAEELVQEAALDMFKMLKRGYEPDNFNAWMWTVIQKKYANWCKSKKIELSRYDTLDASDYEDIAGNECIENDLIRREEILLLHREITLLTSDYRNIVVAYYFDNKKIHEIANATGLPEGTIKRKLSEARKYIKEGMKMVRKNGQRSFAPEDITFGYNVNRSAGMYPNGAPWGLIKNLLSKNIVLEAYNNPSTIEELSLNLGVAMPYIEDILPELVNYSVMIRHENGTYETNFIIMDKDTQLNFYEKELEIGNSYSQVICDIIAGNMDKICEIGFINYDLPKEYLCWSIFHLVTENMIQKVKEEKKIVNFSTKRPNDDEWDIVGNEIVSLPIDSGSYCHRTGNITGTKTGEVKSEIVNIGLKVAGLFTSDGELISGNELSLLSDIFLHDRTELSLNPSEQNTMTSLMKQGIVHASDNKFQTDIPIFNESVKGELSALHKILSEIYHGAAYMELEKVFDHHYDYLMKKVSPKLSNQVKSVVYNSLFNFRSILCNYAYENGMLKIPENEYKKAISMYMIM